MFLSLLLVAAAPTKVYVQATSLNVRAHPNPDAQLLGIAKICDECVLLETKAEWQRVDCGGRSSGWTLAEFLGPQKPTGSEQSRLARDESQPLNRRLAAGKRAVALGEAEQSLVSMLFLKHEMAALRASKRVKARSTPLVTDIATTVSPNVRRIASLVDGPDFVVASLPTNGTVHVQAGKVVAGNVLVELDYQSQPEAELLQSLFTGISEPEMENPFHPITQEGSGALIENGCSPKLRSARREYLMRANLTQTKEAMTLIEAILCFTDDAAIARVRAAIATEMMQKSESTGQKPDRSKGKPTASDVMYNGHAYDVAVSFSGSDFVTIRGSSNGACISTLHLHFDKRWRIVEQTSACD